MTAESEQMLRVLAGAERVVPPAPDGILLTRGSDLRIEPVCWLWQYWLALGKLHILAGAPGQGKTTLAIAMAATVTVGGRWPDGTRCDPGNVLIWSGEDDPGDTLLPRLLAAGADRSKCYFISGARLNGEVVPFDPARDMVQLLAAMEKIGNVQLLVVDPVVSAVTGDSHKNGEVRRALQPLVDLAASARCAVLGITHFAKGGQGQDPMMRVVGSVAFSAVARIVLVAAKTQTEDGESARVIARAKSNIGPDDGGFQYLIEQTEIEHGVEASRVAWGKQVDGNARDLLTEPEPDKEARPREAAVDFLREVLEGGPVPTNTVRQESKDAGHSWATVRRAADSMAVIKRKGGMDGCWYWSLPKMLGKNPNPLTPADGAPSVSSNGSEHLRARNVPQ